jgi:hypothetical protein
MNAPTTFCAVVTALSTMALLSGCAATSPNALLEYQPPPAGEPAAVIDRLIPGAHRVGINCLSYEIVAIDILVGGARTPAIPVVKAKTALQFVLVSGSFEAGRTYYTRCVAVNGQPRAWLADAPDGSGLPQGFTSICTRECPH